ncbi:MAG: 3-oxoacyl-ACP reductase FabG [Oscillospiraceae bacterium]|nr:3-oxoacyl-ACP reductase FabG [Oscillospiraceae bacterium]
MKENKVALVTGGAKGIGEAVCRALAKDGYALAINYNSSKKEAESLKRELSAVTDVEIFKADVSDSKEVDAMFSRIENRLGNVSVLVNNAGISEQALFTDITDDMWSKMINTNLSGAFYCSRRALKNMINEKSGVIINIASMWGEVGGSLEVHYSASKAGLIGLTKALAKEVGLSGIRVNAVSPGVIETDMMAHFTETDKNTLKDETPLNKLGTPKDVANAVSFLASERAEFITGQIISVNGGIVI